MAKKRAATRAGMVVTTIALDKDLRDALTEVIARHTSAYRRPDGSEAPGTPYRLVLGSYPYTP